MMRSAKELRTEDMNTVNGGKFFSLEHLFDRMETEKKEEKEWANDSDSSKYIVQDHKGLFKLFVKISD